MPAAKCFVSDGRSLSSSRVLLHRVLHMFITLSCLLCVTLLDRISWIGFAIGDDTQAAHGTHPMVGFGDFSFALSRPPVVGRATPHRQRSSLLMIKVTRHGGKVKKRERKRVTRLVAFNLLKQRRSTFGGRERWRSPIASQCKPLNASETGSETETLVFDLTSCSKVITLSVDLWGAEAKERSFLTVNLTLLCPPY